MRIALDLRANRRGGVHRWAQCTLRALVDLSGLDLLAICHPQALRPASGVQWLATDRVEGFVRDDPALRARIAGWDPDVTLAFNYLTDPHLARPFAFVLHDLIYLTSIHAAEMERAWLRRWGTHERDRLRRAAAAGDAPDPPPLPTSLGRDLWQLTWTLAEEAGAVVVPSDHTRDQAAALLGTDPAKIAVIPPGDDHLAYAPSPTLRRPLVLWIGDSKPHKQRAFAVEATALARTAIPELHMMIVGPPEETPSPLWLTTIAGCDDHQLTTLYATASCLFVSSSEEGYCLPAAEARAAGLPVVAPPLPALTQSCPDALLYQPGNAHAAAKAITIAFVQPRRPIAPSRPWHRVADEVLNVLELVATDTPRSHRTSS